MYITFDEKTIKQLALDTERLAAFLLEQGFTQKQVKQLRIHIHTRPHGIYTFCNEKYSGIFVPNRNIHVWTYGDPDTNFHDGTLKFQVYQYRLFLRGELNDLHTAYDHRLSVKLAERFVEDSLHLQFLTRRECPAETIVE